MPASVLKRDLKNLIQRNASLNFQAQNGLLSLRSWWRSVRSLENEILEPELSISHGNQAPMRTARLTMSVDPSTEPQSVPHLPGMVPAGDMMAPQAPTDVHDTGVDATVLADLALKAAYTVPQFNTEWAARRLHLPQPLVGELLEQLRADHLLEVLGLAGPFGYRYTISQRGRERAGRLLEISGYVGPAPVSLASYTAMLEWQL